MIDYFIINIDCISNSKKYKSEKTANKKIDLLSSNPNFSKLDFSLIKFAFDDDLIK